jgi:hypothetical protein
MLTEVRLNVVSRSDRSLARKSLLLELMKKTLDFPRSYYSTDVANLLSSNEGEKKSYILGLVVVACILMMIFFIWGGILIILKLRGEEAGCAAGIAFQTTSKQIEKDGSEGHGSGSTDADDFEMSIGSHTADHNEEHVNAYISPRTCSDDIEDMRRKKIRERRTRIALLMVGTTLLLCVPMMLVLVLSPLQKAATNADTIYVVRILSRHPLQLPCL